MTWLRRVGLALAALYSLYGAAMVWLHPQFIYPFSQAPFEGAGYDRVIVDIPDGDPLVLYVNDGADDQPVVLYFMGNLGALELFRPMLDHHTALGRGVVGMTYRGGGGEAGVPSETTLKRDALAAFDTVAARFPDRKIILQGYSLGTGLAIYVGSNRDALGMVLSAPYTRICTLMASASGLPACLLPVQKWDNRNLAKDVRMPVLILHGAADTLIPLHHSVDLADAMAAAGVLPELLRIEKAGHTDLTRFPEYFDAIDAFIGQ